MTARTTAISTKKKAKEHLTNYDRLQVLAYIDEHPQASQKDVANYFSTRSDADGGGLIMDRSTVSRIKANRAKIMTQAKATPSGLDMKKPHQVVSPEVERALYLWVQHLNDKKGEVASGPMLYEKKAEFEKALNIPEEECLTGKGWILPFCRAYKIHQIHRHGKSASVDPVVANAERKRCITINKEYPPKDQFNGDETGFFWSAPPDRGLALEEMNGKKNDKKQITILFACNETGTECLPPFYIGTAKKPRCFGRLGPNEHGFYYRNNKTAWMTSVLYEEWIRALDIQMIQQGRKIIFWQDNFKGHKISYVPRNIKIVSFLPNLTSWVQPMDQGII